MSKQVNFVVLRPRGHDYDVSRVTYEATKRSFMMRCLYGQKQYQNQSKTQNSLETLLAQK